MPRNGPMINAMKVIFNDSKRVVTLYRATKSESNITGSENLTYAAAEQVEIIFFKTETKFEWDQEGLLEKGDALVFDKPGNVNMARNDKIVVDGETFLIKKVVAWYDNKIHIYDAATAYLI
jgi:hypothetical protein